MSTQTFETYQPHPTMTATITPAQRASARRWLSDAYADGRMGQPEFEYRLGRVTAAQDRAEMDMAFLGLSNAANPLDLDPGASRRYDLAPRATGPVATPGARRTGAALLAHVSFFFAWLVGPALVHMVCAPGSYARREAAKAFNWQLASFIGLIGWGIASNFIPDRPADALGGLFTLVWFVLTVLGAVHASRGDDWTNPVMRVVRFQPMRED